MGAIVGYARTSTSDQIAGLEAQERDLRAAGVTKLYSERVSSVAHRSELQRALDYVHENDVFVVTKLDRLARSISDLLAIQKVIEGKGASLRVLSLSLDTTTPTGKLMVNLLGSIAQFERELMLERQREGIAKAKAEGKYRGRVPTARAQSAAIVDLHSQGLGPSRIARRLKVGRSSVYRVLAASRGKESIVED